MRPAHLHRRAPRVLALLAVLAVLLTMAPSIAEAQSPTSSPPPPAPPTPAGASAAAEPPTDQVIVKFVDRELPDAAQEAQLAEAAGGPVDTVRQLEDGSAVVKLDGPRPLDEVEALADAWAARPDVAYAEADARMQPTIEPNDPLYDPEQWHYQAPGGASWGANLPGAWDITTGSASVVTAVLDTGKTNHADLAGRFLPGYDMISYALDGNDGDDRDADASDTGDWVTAGESNGTEAGGWFTGCTVTDSSWHGTHVAGTIGAATDNASGVAGINWVSQIVPVRVLGKCGGYTSDIADGITWAAGLPVSGVPANANPADVINLSLGGGGACSATYQNAITAATAAGSVVVVSAGNSNADASGYRPANCAGVITVAATAENGNRAYYSNYGTSVEIAAPGGDYTVDGMVMSTLNSGTTVPVADTYEAYQGTSMAAPHITGIVSLMRSVDPTLTPAEILTALQTTATPFPGGSTCTTSNCGSGIVNAEDAVLAVASGSIEGTVTGEDTGLPLSGRTVELYKGGVLQGSTVTDVNGDYAFTGLESAVNYKLRFVGTGFYLPEFNGDTPSLAKAAPLTVTVPDVTTADASLIPRSWRANVAGTVTDRVTGAPLQGVNVRVYLDDIYYVGVPTKADGTYAINGMDPAAGTWELRFSSGSGTHALEWWDRGLKPQVATPLSLVINTTSTANAQLTKVVDLPTLSGTVTADGSGTPLAGIEVRVFRNGLAVDVRTTNASGQYSFGNLVPTTYQLRFSDPGAVWKLEWWQNSAGPGGATPVVLTPQTTTTVNPQLGPA